MKSRKVIKRKGIIISRARDPEVEVILSIIAYVFPMALIFSAYFVMLYYATSPSLIADYIFLAILAFPLFLISYLTYHVIFSLIFRNVESKLRKKSIRRKIRIAIVLGIFNDLHQPAFTKTIETLRQNREVGIDFYLVSDSDRQIDREIEEKFADRMGISYLHRKLRTGQRPGAINDWAREYLSKYDYFMVLDKDSVIDDPKEITLMAEAFEHPENRDVAVIQSSLLNANHSTRYAHYIGELMQPSKNFTIKNDMLVFGKALYWGHNGLIRKEAYLDVGGFSQKHLCDDVIFTMKLDSRNWRVAYCTDIVSYEFLPGDFVSFRERGNRWVRANLGTVRYLLGHISKISPSALFYALLPIITYINIIFLMMILIIGLMVPVLSGLGIMSIGQSYFQNIGIGLVLYVIILMLVFFGRIVATRSLSQAWFIFKCSLIDISISLNAIPSQFLTIISYPFIRNRNWNPFSINSRKLNLSQCFRAMSLEFAFGIVLLASALSIGNWIWIITAMPYLANFLLGPFLLYFYARKPKNIQKDLNIFNRWYSI